MLLPAAQQPSTTAGSPPPGPWTPTILAIVIGGLLLVAAILGGGLRIKEIEIPQLNRTSRWLAGVVGLILLVFGLYPRPSTPSTPSNELRSLKCSEIGTLKSAGTSGKTNILFKNETNQKLTAYWIDFDGNKQKFFTLQPKDDVDDHWRQETYEGHPWLIEDDNGHCIAVFKPGAEDATANIMKK